MMLSLVKAPRVEDGSGLIPGDHALVIDDA